MAKSYIILIFCVFVWALNYVARQFLLQEFSPLLLSVISLTVVSIVFLLWAYLARSFVWPTRKEWLLLLMSASIGLIANQLFLLNGLHRTSATHASLIFTMSPFITAALASVFLREKITSRMIAGMMVAFLGLIAALNMQSFSVSAGDLMILGATFTFSCNLIIIRVLSRRMTPFILTVYSFTLSSVLFDPYVLTTVKVDWSHPFNFWCMAILTVIVAQGLVNVLWNKGMETVGAARSTIVLNLQPIMTMLLDFIIFGHHVSFVQLIGVTLVLIGVLFGTVHKEKLNYKAETA
ncbi:DMT family transporter [Paenibacillus aceris]|uniref:Drug/metabolite transporter (DMT)-like permease n=1 Tax=Paenibacillus aceris TaxID=869555 RepID=A0ABS4I0D0_9BACL|nr:DMT family transporter [Paenibacillus aceris]MBP1964345.1 drug/metabolite transporter (DMT)-like permease [Paenibacillus aceris]